MLIATQYGLYSILPSGPESFRVCGGCRRDLENLLALTDFEVPIETAREHGERCWIDVGLDEVFEVLTQLSMNTGCTDFRVERVDVNGNSEGAYRYAACFEGLA